MAAYGSGYSNWSQLLCWVTYPFYEIAISGPQALLQLKELHQHYIPNKLVAISDRSSALPLLQDPVSYDAKETNIFVCKQYLSIACKHCNSGLDTNEINSTFSVIFAPYLQNLWTLLH